MKIIYSVTQCAKLWKITREGVRQRILDGTLPKGYKASKVGNTYVITFTKIKPKVKPKKRKK